MSSGYPCMYPECNKDAVYKIMIDDEFGAYTCEDHAITMAGKHDIISQKRLEDMKNAQQAEVAS